LGVEKEQI